MECYITSQPTITNWIEYSYKYVAQPAANGQYSQLMRSEECIWVISKLWEPASKWSWNLQLKLYIVMMTAQSVLITGAMVAATAAAAARWVTEINLMNWVMWIRFEWFAIALLYTTIIIQTRIDAHIDRMINMIHCSNLNVIIFRIK